MLMLVPICIKENPIKARNVFLCGSDTKYLVCFGRIISVCMSKEDRKKDGLCQDFGMSQTGSPKDPF